MNKRLVWTFVGMVMKEKSKNWEKILPQCYFVHHKSHAECFAIECLIDSK
jgi:hypothetical protein